MNRILIAAFALSTACSAAAAQNPPAAAGDEGVTFERLIVTTPAEPLDRPYVLLHKMLDDALPCLGCGGVREATRSPVLSLLDYLLLPTQPAPVDRATAEASYVRYEAFGPDLGQR